MLMFIKPFEKLILFLLPVQRNEQNQTELRYLKVGVTTTPELFIGAARKEIDIMAGMAASIASKLLHALKADTDALFEDLVQDIYAQEKASDTLEYKITEFLKNLTHEQLSRDMVSEIMHLLDQTSYLEKIADHGERIAKLLTKAHDIKAFNVQDYERLETIGQQVRKIIKHMRSTILPIEQLDKSTVLDYARKQENILNDMRHELREEKTSNDFEKKQISPAGLTIYADILTSFEKMGDYAFNVVESNTDQPKHVK